MKWARATTEKKYFNRAADALKTAQKISPLETDNYFQLASVYFFGAREFDSHYYAKTINQLKRALILEPYSSWAYYLLGMSYVETGYFREAVKNLKRAVDITPNFEDAYFYLGLAYERLDNKREAIAAYRKALLLNSKNWGTKEALERLKSQKRQER
jgi:tetratricopeptide (TPR) repeat protein